MLPGTRQVVNTDFVQEASRGIASHTDAGWPLQHPLLPKESPSHLSLEKFQRLPTSFHWDRSLSPNAKVYMTFCFAILKTFKGPFQAKLSTTLFYDSFLNLISHLSLQQQHCRGQYTRCPLLAMPKKKCSLIS